MTKPLKLLALKLEDMSVISSVCQDALVSVADISFSHEDNRFALILSRFCWEDGPQQNQKNKQYYRTHTAIRFDQVDSVAYKGLSKRKSDQLLSLLTIAYAPHQAGEEEEGHIMLQFADDKAIRLKISKVNVALEDVGERWTTPWHPDHKEAD